MSTQHYAARWAAKKAVLQALGVGMHGGMTWKDIEVRSENKGQAKIGLAGVVRDVSVASESAKSTSRFRPAGQWP